MGLNSADIRKFALVLALLFLFALTTTIGVKTLTKERNQGVDWYRVIRPGIINLIEGKSPYEKDALLGFPPWTLVMLLPLTVLPETIGRVIFLYISMVAFVYAAHKLGGKLINIIIFILSPIVLHSLLNANLDWMPVLGFVLKPQIGLFFVTVKPQMGSVVILYWLVEAWRRGGMLEVLRVFSPIVLATLVSFGFFGVWPLNYQNIRLASQDWNASLWPGSIPIGLGLTVASIRLREFRLAIPASPFLSPYVLFHAWSGALVSIVSFTPELLSVVIGLWLMVALRIFNLGL